MSILEIGEFMVSVSLVILIGMCCYLLYKVIKLVINLEKAAKEMMETARGIMEPFALAKEAFKFIKMFKKEED